MARATENVMRWSRVSFIAATEVLVLLLIPRIGVASARCELNEARRTTFPTAVHQAPPSFSTGSGWTLAPVLTTLPRGTPVWICERKTFGFISGKRWVRIQFDEPRREGWVPGEDTIGANIDRARERSPGTWLSLLGIGVARANDRPSGSSASTDEPDLEVSARHTPVAWDLILFDLFLFVFVLLGIGAKGIFDGFGPQVRIRDCLARSAKAFVVSPIVFLGLMKVADVGISSLTTGGLVSALVAFEHGFFWQTVLVSAGKPASRPAQVEAAAAGVTS